MPKKQRRRLDYSSKSEQQVREAARNLRQLLQLDDAYTLDLRLVLSRLGHFIPNFRLKSAANSDLPDAEAKAYCEARILKVRTTVLNALEKYGDARARWTIAHEIGHLWLKHPGRLFRKLPGGNVSSAQKQLEREAHIFASEFLAPTHLAEQCATPDEIRALFCISPRAAKARKEELEKSISPNKGRTDNLPAVIVPSPSLRIQNPTIPADAAIHTFASMHYNEDNNRLYREILKPAVEDLGIVCRRADEMPGTDGISDQIKRAISSSHILLAEISGFNPNVMHEIGIAQSFEIPTIFVCRDEYPEDRIPSNIRHIRRIMYRNDAPGGSVLRRDLMLTLESILNCWGRHPKVEPSRQW